MLRYMSNIINIVYACFIGVLSCGLVLALSGNFAHMLGDRTNDNMLLIAIAILCGIVVSSVILLLLKLDEISEVLKKEGK